MEDRPTDRQRLKARHVHASGHFEIAQIELGPGRDVIARVRRSMLPACTVSALLRVARGIHDAIRVSPSNKRNR